MDYEYELKYHQEEEYNWWFIGRRDAIVKLVSLKNKNLKILDIGCAGGALLLELKKRGFTNLTGLDVSENAIAVSKKRGLDNVYVMDGSNPSFEKESFDIIISSDSLEHMIDDEKSLKNWYHLLKPGGELFIFVPAFMHLWSDHDVVNHHYRRYTAPQLKSKVENAGFHVTRHCYWNSLMYLPTSTFRLLQKIKHTFIRSHKSQDQLIRFNSFVNHSLTKIILTENLIFKNIGFPIGVSVYVQGIKK